MTFVTRLGAVGALLVLAWTSVLRAQAAAPNRAAPNGAAADSLWLRGTVTDTAGRPIENAIVRVEPDGVGTRTNRDGVFSLRVAAGPSTLVVQGIGFAALRQDIALVGGEDVRLDIALGQVAVILDSFRVESRRPYMPPGAPRALDDFYRRRATGLGRYATREDIERAGSVRAVLASIPGIRFTTDAFGNISGLTVPRCGMMPSGAASDEPSNTVAWFVDGQRVLTPPELRDGDIEAIEIYRGSSTMPADAVGNACAAVFLWLRRS